MKAWKVSLAAFTFFIAWMAVDAQPLHKAAPLSRQDTLRGSLTTERIWWDVVSYELSVTPDFNSKTLRGSNIIGFKITGQSGQMQIDLQPPMRIDSVSWKNQPMPFSRNGNVYLLQFPPGVTQQGVQTIRISFSGRPREAVNPPWDGGWIWRRDLRGNPWMSVACQGLGASVWYPCKDYQGDEPDSAKLRITVPDSLSAVGNGRLVGQTRSNGMATYTWAVQNPINSYNLVPYIGKYVHWEEKLQGEKGMLDCSYYVLDGHRDSAQQQFKQVRPMLTCLEKWFGPYPFYEDGYKLVESPHLGMEHQSAIAYGNGFRNGYKGRDLSNSGWGLQWDFIIVHESAHEWFGNNITYKDLADMWIHESFANYSETLYTECISGKDAGVDYVTGTRSLILNDIPIIAPYGVNREGSGDMYYKGGNMLHMIRTIIQDDERFRKILRGLNKQFYHQTVTAKDVEDYISKQSGIAFDKVFGQYLTTTQIPVLQYKFSGKKLSYRWTNCVKGFDMPVKISADIIRWIKPTENWQTITVSRNASVEIDRNFYVFLRPA